MSTESLLTRLDTARSRGMIAETAFDNLREWLQQPWYEEYRSDLVAMIEADKWQELNELFWTHIPFGTAGRRGRMAAIGCNAINRRTVAETVQALATYLKGLKPDTGELSCVIAYDTRHRSREFAELSAEIMVAAGFRVLFFDGFRPTPLLSTTIRYQRSDCGIMISASHNPPADNAIKVFWEGGAQLRPPHDTRILDEMALVTEIQRTDFDQALVSGQVICCQAEMDDVYFDAVHRAGHNAHASKESKEGLGILYSPLHGVGSRSVLPILQRAGFTRLKQFAAHASPDGDFPNVPNHVANPERPEVFDSIAKAAGSDVDLVLATDPDADRIGCLVRREVGATDWIFLNGNQIGALLGEYLLRRRQTNGNLRSSNFVVKTLVTSDLLVRIAESYGIRVFGDVLTGFKWISKVVDDVNPDDFVLGTEEAHGYLAGTYCRDKDGGIAALLLAEFAAEAKLAGLTLHDELNQLYGKYGLHHERTIATLMPGADGMQRMAGTMRQLRQHPPARLGEMRVVSFRDYQNGTVQRENGVRQPLDGPSADLIFLDLDRPGYKIGIRPSGTEPKLKCYFFAVEHPTAGDLAEAQRRADGMIDRLHIELTRILSTDREQP